MRALDSSGDSGGICSALEGPEELWRAIWLLWALKGSGRLWGLWRFLEEPRGLSKALKDSGGLSSAIEGSRGH